jgi:hypothetical protein
VKRRRAPAAPPFSSACAAASGGAVNTRTQEGCPPFPRAPGRDRRICNIIEAPWLVNGGHGASVSGGTCSEDAGDACEPPPGCAHGAHAAGRRSATNAHTGGACARCAPPTPQHCIARTSAASAAAALRVVDGGWSRPHLAAVVAPGHAATTVVPGVGVVAARRARALVEAPWLVNGGHGASLKSVNSPSAGAHAYGSAQAHSSFLVGRPARTGWLSARGGSGRQPS